MILDFRNLDRPKPTDADICIIGGGVAGIAMARALAGSRLRILLLESGGLTFDAATQELYRGTSTGIPNFPLDASRLRFLGGSSNHWEGWCAPLDETDFEERRWIEGSGWPLKRSNLEPWYARASEWLELGIFEPDSKVPERWRREGWRGALPAFDPNRVRPGFWRFSKPPLRVGERERAALEQQEGLEVWLHSNVTHLKVDARSKRIASVDVQSLDAKAHVVRARTFVVACGGLENARLLLASASAAQPTGLGNTRDHVGRHFMDHFQVDIAHVAAKHPEALALAMPNPSEVGAEGKSRKRGVFYTLAPGVQRREQVGNSSAFLGIAYGARQEANEVPGALEALAARLGFGSQTAGEPSDGAKPIHALTLRCFGDQVPNPNSRVTLGTKRDALGMPRLQLHWQLTEADHRGLRLLAQTLGAELTRTGLARVRIPQWLSTNEPTWSESLQGGHHPMGTTRMSARASDGVVNEDCRVHDIENLFIAGSSVFPTAGHANPTLTLVALAFRLAEHVKTTLSKAGEK